MFRGLDIPRVVTRILRDRNVLNSHCHFTLNASCQPESCYIRCNRDYLGFLRQLYRRRNLRCRFRRDHRKRLLIFNSSRAMFPELRRPATCLRSDTVITSSPMVGTFALTLRAHSANIAHHSCSFRGPLLRLRDNTGSPSPLQLRSCNFPNRFASHRRNGRHAQQTLRQRHDSCQRTAKHDSRSVLLDNRFLPLVGRPHRR